MNVLGRSTRKLPAHRIILTVVVAALLIAPGVAYGAKPVLTLDEVQCTTSTSSDLIGMGQHHYGESVAIDGNTMAVGASLIDEVYVYTNEGSGWVLQQIVSLSGQNFGWSVALSGDTLSVIDLDANLYVYVREGETWSLAQTIPSLADGQAIASEVAMTSDYIVVGFPTLMDVGYDLVPVAAKVYGFDGETWVEAATLIAPFDVLPEFGTAVAIDGDYIVVGGSDGDYYTSGDAYVSEYTGDGWSQLEPLGVRSTAVCVRDDIIAVADGNNGSGAVAIFELDEGSWTQTAELHTDYAGTTSGFGVSVTLQDGYVVVGSPFDTEAGEQAGAAHLFTKAGNGWTQTDKVYGIPGAYDILGVPLGTRFGISVASTESTLVVGALHEMADGWPRGTAHIYDIVSSRTNVPQGPR